VITTLTEHHANLLPWRRYHSAVEFARPGEPGRAPRRRRRDAGPGSGGAARAAGGDRCLQRDRGGLADRRAGRARSPLRRAHPGRLRPAGGPTAPWISPGWTWTGLPSPGTRCTPPSAAAPWSAGPTGWPPATLSRRGWLGRLGERPGSRMDRSPGPPRGRLSQRGRSLCPGGRLPGAGADRHGRLSAEEARLGRPAPRNGWPASPGW